MGLTYRKLGLGLHLAVRESEMVVCPQPRRGNRVDDVATEACPLTAVELKQGEAT